MVNREFLPFPRILGEDEKRKVKTYAKFCHGSLDTSETREYKITFKSSENLELFKAMIYDLEKEKLNTD